MIDTRFIELDCFSMGINCTYQLKEAITLNIIPLKVGHLVVTKDFDRYFVGIGKSAETAIYDWKIKFHGYFQRFEQYGTIDEWEEELYEKLKENLNEEVYLDNYSYTRLQEGEICSCREKDMFPCSYKLSGSDETIQVPDYMFVDSTFMTLEKGDKFKGVFEYNARGKKANRILYAERI